MVSVNVFSLANILFTNCINFRRFDIKGFKKHFFFLFWPTKVNQFLSQIILTTSIRNTWGFHKYPNLIQKFVVSFSVLFSWSFLDGGKSAVLQYSEAFHSPPSSSFCCQTLLMAFLFHQNAMCCSILYHRTFLAEFQEKNRLCISLVALPVLCPAERVSGQ